MSVCVSVMYSRMTGGISFVSECGCVCVCVGESGDMEEEGEGE